jgi:hypothetical protein
MRRPSVAKPANLIGKTLSHGRDVNDIREMQKGFNLWGFGRLIIRAHRRFGSSEKIGQAQCQITASRGVTRSESSTWGTLVRSAMR